MAGGAGKVCMRSSLVGLGIHQGYGFAGYFLGLGSGSAVTVKAKGVDPLDLFRLIRHHGLVTGHAGLILRGERGEGGAGRVA